MHEPTVKYSVTDAVAHIELHRPTSLNAWTAGMGRELLAAVRRATADPEARSGLITGAGAAFSAGADVKDKRELTPAGDPDLSTRLRTIYNPIVLGIRESPKPFVAAIHGACAGLGVSLALACDIVVAAEDAYFLLAFVRIGVMPDGGATAFLPERIGYTRAAELCLLGERLPASTAHAWGLVHHLASPDTLHTEGRRIAVRLASVETDELGRVKRALGRDHLDALRRQLELEADLQQRHGPSHDYAEGRAAFAAKRAARFIGS